MTGSSKPALLRYILVVLLKLVSIQATKRFSDGVHCYESVTTLDKDTPTNANCFEVSRDGLISRVFQGEQNSTGHVYPGLWDGHGHLLQYGELLQSVNLFGSSSLSDAISKVKVYAFANPSAGSKDEWLRGVGWDQAAFGGMPTAVSAAQPFLLAPCGLSLTF
jgi:hypothetical protein